MKKKGSMFVILVFIAIILAIFFLIAFQRGELEKQQRDRGAEQALRDTLTSYSDMVKLYTYMSIRHAATKAANESMADEIGRNYWIVHGVANAPTESQAKEHLIERIIPHVEGYMKWLERSGRNTFGDIVITDSGDITEISIGDTDANYFQITATGTDFQIETSDKSQFIVGEHSYTVEANPVRYFLIHNMVERWVKDEVLTQAVCNKMSVSKGSSRTSPCQQANSYIPYLTQNDIRNTVEDSVRNLEFSMSPGVECSHEFIGSIEVSDNVRTAPCGCTCSGSCVTTIKVCDAPSCGQSGVSRTTCDLGSGVSSPEGIVNFPANRNGAITQTERLVENDKPVSGGSCFGWGSSQNVGFEINLVCQDELYESPIGPENFENLILDINLHFDLSTSVDPPYWSSFCHCECIPITGSPPSCP